MTSDASPPAGDQYHLLGQVLPPARQQRQQTRSYDIIEHVNGEQKHATRALQLHVAKRSRAVHTSVYAASLRAPPTPPTTASGVPKQATQERPQVCPRVRRVIRSLGACGVSSSTGEELVGEHSCVTPATLSHVGRHASGSQERCEWSVITPVTLLERHKRASAAQTALRGVRSSKCSALALCSCLVLPYILPPLPWLRYFN